MRTVAHALTLLLIALPGAARAAGSEAATLAYIDPGAGSFILQALVATLAGIAVAVHTYWHKIKVFFGLAAPEEDDSDEPPAEE
jgi:hypothetical protein